jgi:hypothetical protein
MHNPSQNVEMQKPASMREVQNLFEKIQHLQAGCIHPATNKFIPVWPFCFKSLQMGNLIHDSNGRCDTV